MEALAWLIGTSGVVLLISTAHLNRETKWLGRFTSSLLVALLSVPLVAIAGFHKCDEGNVPPIIVLATAGLGTTFPWIRFLNVWIIRVSIALVLAFGLATASYLTSSYHLDEITGNPDYASERFWHTWITGQYPRDEAKIELLRAQRLNDDRSESVDE